MFAIAPRIDTLQQHFTRRLDLPGQFFAFIRELAGQINGSAICSAVGKARSAGIVTAAVCRREPCRAE